MHRYFSISIPTILSFAVASVSMTRSKNATVSLFNDNEQEEYSFQSYERMRIGRALLQTRSLSGGEDIYMKDAWSGYSSSLDEEVVMKPFGIDHRPSSSSFPHPGAVVKPHDVASNSDSQTFNGARLKKRRRHKGRGKRRERARRKAKVTVRFRITKTLA